MASSPRLGHRPPEIRSLRLRGPGFVPGILAKRLLVGDLRPRHSTSTASRGFPGAQLTVSDFCGRPVLGGGLDNVATIISEVTDEQSYLQTDSRGLLVSSRVMLLSAQGIWPNRLRMYALGLSSSHDGVDSYLSRSVAPSIAGARFRGRIAVEEGDGREGHRFHRRDRGTAGSRIPIDVDSEGFEGGTSDSVRSFRAQALRSS